MKLWKGASLAILLCCLSLCVLLTKLSMPAMLVRLHHQVALPVPPPLLSKSTSPLPSPSSPTSSSSPSSIQSSPTSSPEEASSSLPVTLAHMGGLRRRVRSADSMGSLLSEFTYLFQSFTEGELKQIVGALVDRKSHVASQEDLWGEDDALSQTWSIEERLGRRTKRARRVSTPCSLHEVRRTVTELGLGYESDETVVFRYCSGKCAARRRNYDIILEYLHKGGQLEESSGGQDRRGRGRSRKDKARYSPCCRPTRYEKDISFLGNNNIFYTIPDVSARECGCV